MFPRRSPRFDLMKTTGKTAPSLAPRKPSPKKRKVYPKADKSRAQWNPALEKSLVNLLLEHNTTYHRGQNGWGSETWNEMVRLFHSRNPHVKFTKSQVQEKEKELKREYKLLLEARKQSGAGWNMDRCMIEADAHLWDNMIISWPKIKKFRTKPFPLFDHLGELYDGHIAEGSYNFTSTSQVQSGDPFEDEDLQILDNEKRPEVENERMDEVENERMAEVENDRRAAVENDRRAEVENERRAELQNVRKAVGAAGSKPQKIVKKPNKNDGMVGVVERYVMMKEKQAEEERAEARDVNKFTISHCIVVLQGMSEIATQDRVKAFKVFKCPQNRETFLTSADVDREAAIMWLQQEIADLP